MRHSRTRRLAAGLVLSLMAVGSLGAVPASATTVAAVSAEAQVNVRKELRALEKAFAGRIGAYALDTATGKTVAYRANERFPLLSTFKAMACAAVLHKARTSAPGLMDKRIRWTKDDLLEYSPITEKHVADGLTVAQLCEATITVSDNTAGNLILKEIGGPAGLTKYLRSLKDPISRLDRYEPELNDWTPKDKRDTTTPAAIARDLRVLTAGNALHAKDREQFNAWLIANKTGDARIRAGLPKTWTIGDKTGTNSTGFGGGNDIAVIWPEKGAAPILMAVYTNRTPGLPTDDKTIAKTATILARGLGRL